MLRAAEIRRALSRLLAALVFGAALQGCSQSEAPQEESAVVVYAAYDDSSYLPTLFNAYTQETGTVVIVRNGSAAEIVGDILLKRATPPADVLITPSVAGAWQVAEESELRPNYSSVLDSVPASLRDPDKYWTALSYRTAVIVYDPGQVDGEALGNYEDLAAESLRRKVCLTSSALPINRVVIAMLMRKLGRRETELAVRGWVANLAQPPLSSEARLLQAIAEGDCGIGIVSISSTAGSRLGLHLPPEVYYDIEAIGVTRHAGNPEAAVALIDWLLSAEVQARHATATAGLAATAGDESLPGIAAVAADLDEAEKLAERARYR